MLDIKRLSSNPLLMQSGWNPAYKVDLQKRYMQFEQMPPPPQVPIQEVFPAARDLIETLDGIMIHNVHPELKLGPSCDAIEFDFFHYDACWQPELLSIQSKIGKKVLFIGIGYDIIGDWLIDEEGRIYFSNKLHHRLHMVSEDIYQFLEQDLYQLTDRDGICIL